MSTWLSTKKIEAKRATKMLPATGPTPTLTYLLTKHTTHKKLLHNLVAASRDYSEKTVQHASSEEALLLALSAVYDAGIENDVKAANPGIDLAKLHPTALRHPRSLDLTKKLTPTAGGAGADATNAADFAANLLEGWANGVSSELVLYMRTIESLSTHVDEFELSRLIYDHYIAKISAISKKAALDEDGMEAPRLAERMQRNMGKLRDATAEYDRKKEVVERMLRASTCGKGIEGRLNPIADRMTQFLGLRAGCRFNVVREHAKNFSRTKGTVGDPKEEDSSSDTDSDVGEEDEAYFDDENEWDVRGAPISDTADLSKHNFLRVYKPRFKSITQHMPREKPKHKEGWLTVRQEKKLMSSRHFCVLRGDILSLYMNANEPLGGMEPIKNIRVKNASEWEQKAPHGIVVEDGHTSTQFYLKTDEDAELWLKSCLRASCWDAGRSRMNILNTLKKVKELSAPNLASLPEEPLPSPPSSKKKSRVARAKTISQRLAELEVAVTARVFAGGALDSPLAQGTKNPFANDSSDEELVPPLQLNPFRSSYESVTPPRSGSESTNSQAVDDFNALAVDGVVTFEALLGWEEIKSAIAAGDLNATEISLLWTEVGGGKGLDQGTFVKILDKLEKLLVS